MRVPGLLVMCGGNASVRGQLLWDCWRKAYIAVFCSAALHLGRKGRTFWIGTAILDRLFSYPERHNLSSSWFPIHFVAARAHMRPHVGPFNRTGATPPTRRSWGFRAYRGVNVQSLVAAVASFRFQAGEAAFLFSFLTFLLLGRGSSFSCHAFAFCLNRCL